MRTSAALDMRLKFLPFSPSLKKALRYHLQNLVHPPPPSLSNKVSGHRLSSTSIPRLRLYFSAFPFFSCRGLGFDPCDRSLRRFSASSSPSRASEDDKQRRLIPAAMATNFSIDLKGLRAQNAFSIVSPSSRVSDCVILRLYDNEFNFENDSQVMEFDVSNEKNCHYMVIFQYGSVVLFNVSERKADGCLKIVEKHALTLLPEKTKDDYAVVEQPNLETWMQGGLDHIMLKNLSIDGIHTIGSVLGQSIALDYYVRQVDGMVELFSNINQEMEKTSNFNLKSKRLLQLVGKANSNLEAVILKLKLFDRPEIAWKNANYAQIWEYLRDDYELTMRFGSLQLKLDFVERNIDFFRNVLDSRKMELLSWLIVLLLVSDILLSIFIHQI